MEHRIWNMENKQERWNKQGTGSKEWWTENRELGETGNKKRKKEHGIRNRDQKTGKRILATENLGQRTGKEHRTYNREERQNRELVLVLIANRIVSGRGNGQET
jgi:hypothetical protein